MLKTFGRYRLLRHIATGGMGEVYLAEAVGAAGFAKRLVIKTLRPELSADPRLIDQFVAEGRLLEQLDHPNIAQILDLGMFEGTYFLAMEYVEGQDLRDLRRALPGNDGVHRLDEVPVLCIVDAIAEALDHAATRKDGEGRPLAIVHHDVTPSNIMVRRDGHVKLVDFGVARSAVWQRLDPGVLRGKLPYLSPEQAALQPADGRADIFSLGLVAYELLAGERALDVVDVEGLSQAFDLLPARLQKLSGLAVGQPTLDLIDAMLARDRDVRVSTVAEVSERARLRLVELGVVSSIRAVGDALSPAFDVLQRQESGFDRTLAAIVAAGAGGPEAAAATDGAGTVSLPGVVGIARPVTQPPLSQPPLSQPPQPAPSGLAVERSGQSPSGAPTAPGRSRRRILMSASLALLLAAGAAGWWLGDRDRGTPASEAGPDLPAPTPLTPAAAIPVQPTPAAVPATAGLASSVAVVAAPPSQPATATSTPPALPDPVTAPEVPAGESPRAPERQAQATFRFLVFPAYGVVSVDGRTVAVRASGRYVLALKAGRHVVTVRDPTSGRRTRHEVNLAPGEDRTLPGGFRLVTDLP